MLRGVLEFQFQRFENFISRFWLEDVVRWGTRTSFTTLLVYQDSNLFAATPLWGSSCVNLYFLLWHLGFGGSRLFFLHVTSSL